MTNGEKFKEVFGFGADGSRVIAVNATWWDCEFQNSKPITKRVPAAKPDNRLTPKKPKLSADTWVCPACGRDVVFQMMLGDSTLFHGRHDFCQNCMQAIDWEGMKDPCVKCKIKKFCREQPEDLSCEDVMKIWKVGDDKETEGGEDEAT